MDSSYFLFLTVGRSSFFAELWILTGLLPLFLAVFKLLFICFNNFIEEFLSLMLSPFWHFAFLLLLRYSLSILLRLDLLIDFKFLEDLLCNINLLRAEYVGVVLPISSIFYFCVFIVNFWMAVYFYMNKICHISDQEINYIQFR